jgi:hypothetical protein
LDEDEEVEVNLFSVTDLDPNGTRQIQALENTTNEEGNLQNDYAKSSANDEDE